MVELVKLLLIVILIGVGFYYYNEQMKEASRQVSSSPEETTSKVSEPVKTEIKPEDLKENQIVKTELPEQIEDKEPEKITPPVEEPKKISNDISSIIIEDTRSLNSSPEEYRMKGRGVYYEFKDKNVVSGDSCNVSSNYLTLETIVPWSIDLTGGPVSQISYTGDCIRIRTEILGSNTFGPWLRLGEL